MRSFQSTDSSYDDLQVPENLHRLSVKIQHKAHKGAEIGYGTLKCCVYLRPLLFNNIF